MGSEQKKRAATRSVPEEEVETTESTEVYDTSGIDDLLDEIDDVLEENAEEFVKSYIQKGGE